MSVQEAIVREPLLDCGIADDTIENTKKFAANNLSFFVTYTHTKQPLLDCGIGDDTKGISDGSCAGV